MEENFLRTCSPVALKVFAAFFMFELDVRPLSQCLRLTSVQIQEVIREIAAAEREQWSTTVVADAVRVRS